MPSHHKFGAVGASDGRGVRFSIPVAHSTGLLKAAMNDPTNAPANAAAQSHDQNPQTSNDFGCRQPWPLASVSGMGVRVLARRSALYGRARRLRKRGADGLPREPPLAEAGDLVGRDQVLVLLMV
jgi:hypothetical protein